MFCTKCGSEIPDGQKTCTKCEKLQEQPAGAPEISDSAMGRNMDPAPIQQMQPAVPAGYAPVVGIGTYLGMFIVSWIPVVGFIMAIIWAFDSRNRSKSNFAVVLIILQVLGVVLGVLAYSASISLLKTVLKGLASGM